MYNYPYIILLLLVVVDSGTLAEVIAGVPEVAKW